MSHILKLKYKLQRNVAGQFTYYIQCNYIVVFPRISPEDTPLHAALILTCHFITISSTGCTSRDTAALASARLHVARQAAQVQVSYNQTQQWIGGLHIKTDSLWTIYLFYSRYIMRSVICYSCSLQNKINCFCSH